MTDKPSREDVLKAIREGGWTGIYSHWTSATDKENLTVPVEWDQIERFAAAMYSAGAEDIREQAAGICHRFGNRGMNPHECEGAIRALPITHTNTEGEQG